MAASKKRAHRLLLFPIFVALIASCAAPTCGCLIRSANCSPAEGGAIKLSLQLPIGVECKSFPCAPNSSMSGMLTVESAYDGELVVDIKLIARKPLELSIGGGAAADEGDCWAYEASKRLYCRFDSRSELFEVRVPPNASEGDRLIVEAVAAPRTPDGTRLPEQRRAVTLIVASSLDGVRIIDAYAPSNSRGERDVTSTGIISVGEVPEYLRLLGVRGTSLTSALTFIGVKVRNSYDFEVPIVITVDFLNPSTGEPVERFSSVPYSHQTGVPKVYAMGVLPARGEATFAIPLYVLPGYEDLDKIRGDYVARVELRILGSDLLVDSFEFPLSIRPFSYERLFAFGLGIASAAGFVGYLGVRQRSMLRSFKTKHLVTIGLFAALAFVTVSFPGAVIWPIADAALGPFSFLATGVLYEILLYMIYSVALVLIPKVGTISLLALTRFLLYTCIFGRFSVLSIFWLASMAVALEIALYVAGLTRKGIEDNPPKLKLALFAAAMGVADAYAAFVNMNLYMLFYRLYYADWYLWMYYAIDGFAYTFVGALAGLSLGLKLRRAYGE